MLNFDAWLRQPITTETTEEDVLYLHCIGCGKDEMVTKKALENGDAWATEELCGGSHLCCP